jgi:hypothetical protein
MKEAIKMVKHMFASIRRTIRLNKRTINENNNRKIKITEIENESTI